MADIYAINKSGKHTILSLPEEALRVGEISKVHEFYANDCTATVKRTEKGWELLHTGRKRRAKTLEAILDAWEREQARSSLERRAGELQERIDLHSAELKSVERRLKGGS